MRLQESGEMYLETIYILSRQNAFVRSVDISEYMGFSKPSISRAMNLLKKAEYIVMDDENHITLTKSGSEIAEKIYERYQLLTDLLRDLGVSSEVAAEDACRIEHDISDETFRAVKNAYLRFRGDASLPGEHNA